ncbi:MAG TPA: amidohydrolase family protein [Steroidobacteraceae bacterium]|nr:amidohydrolase family protein [Steroidobacteraceae bacterium]
MTGPNLTRRALLGSLAAASVYARIAAAQSTPNPAGLVDVHHHFIPPFWFDEVKDHISRQGGGRIVPNWYGWSEERALERMDETGVATAIVSISAPGVWFGDVTQGRRLSRETSLFAAQMRQRHPKRFGFFAALPLPDIEGSLREIEYAFDQLHANGVVLMTSYGDRWLGDPSFDPVMQELDRRGAIVYVHPGSPACCSQLMSYVPPFLTEFTQDTNRTITSLMFSGQLVRRRAIRFIFSHAGGTIPMLAGRISQLSTSVPQLAAAVPDGVEAELRRLYYEVANSANRPAIAALLSLVPATQVMFGSDFPLVPIAATQAKLSGLGLSESDLASLSRGTAAKLFALADR